MAYFSSPFSVIFFNNFSWVNIKDLQLHIILRFPVLGIRRASQVSETEGNLCRTLRGNIKRIAAIFFTILIFKQMESYSANPAFKLKGWCRKRQNESCFVPRQVQPVYWGK